MPQPAGATQDEVRRHNLATLLEHLHRDGATSRADLTALLGLNRSTTAALVADLASRGLVDEADPGPRRRSGRPSPLVRPRPDRVVALAVEIDVTVVRAALVGIGGTVLARRVAAPLADLPDPVDVAARAADLAREVLAEVRPPAKLAGVGVGVAGVVRQSDGLVHIAPNLGWRDVPLGELVAGALALDVPVHVGNDANLGAVAEHVRGAARGVADLAYVSSDVGIGVGALIGGQPLSGADGYFGEFGHLPLYRRGRQCRCGAHGCWETEVGTHALLRRAGRPLGEGRDGVHAILARAVRGDPDARTAVDHVAGELGTGLAALVNILNPRLIVLGGFFAELWPVAEARATRSLVRHALPDPARRVRIGPGQLGDDAPLLGAAETVLRSVIRNPAVVPVGA